MDPTLAPCSRCRRHVRSHELTCPFCGQLRLCREAPGRAAVAALAALVLVGCKSRIEAEPHDRAPPASAAPSASAAPPTSAVAPASAAPGSMAVPDPADGVVPALPASAVASASARVIPSASPPAPAVTATTHPAPIRTSAPKYGMPPHLRPGTKYGMPPIDRIVDPL